MAMIIKDKVLEVLRDKTDITVLELVEKSKDYSWIPLYDSGLRDVLYSLKKEGYVIHREATSKEMRDSRYDRAGKRWSITSKGIDLVDSEV